MEGKRRVGGGGMKSRLEMRGRRKDDGEGEKEFTLRNQRQEEKEREVIPNSFLYTHERIPNLSLLYYFSSTRSSSHAFRDLGDRQARITRLVWI